ncbi:phosphate transporter [Blyttiomyces sp. JEL0837]|nr:phosphate transporter [Blyttiomyces sp. JEL0837]
MPPPTVAPIRLSWRHILAVLVSGVGFFTDAYDLFIINLVTPMISYVYYEDKIPPAMDGFVKGAATVGTFLGQLTFGYLADKWGRKKLYGMELVLIVMATFGSATATIFAPDPLSAVITSEFASNSQRGMMVALVFAMQGVGILVGSLIAIISLAIGSSAIKKDPVYLDNFFGAIPALCTIYARLTMPETPHFAAIQGTSAQEPVAAGNEQQAVAQAGAELDAIEGGTPTANGTDRPSFDQNGDGDSLLPQAAPMGRASGGVRTSSAANAVEGGGPSRVGATFQEHYATWDNFKVLLGCSVAWFALDVGFYGIQLNQSVVLKAIGFADQSSPFSDIWSQAVGNLVIALLGTVPGYWLTVFTIEKYGRIKIQLMGFYVLAATLGLLSVTFHPLVNNGLTGVFVAIYTVAQLFFNFGPNATTFILPGEVFPTKYRTTSHGISAASGKLGAMLAAYLFGPLKDIGGKNAFLPALFFVFALFMLLGAFVTRWIPETAGKSLDEISGDGAIATARRQGRVVTGAEGTMWDADDDEVLDIDVEEDGEDEDEVDGVLSDGRREVYRDQVPGRPGGGSDNKEGFVSMNPFVVEQSSVVESATVNSEELAAWSQSRSVRSEEQRR